jgi:hypothetical protein
VINGRHRDVFVHVRNIGSVFVVEDILRLHEVSVVDDALTLATAVDEVHGFSVGLGVLVDDGLILEVLDFVGLAGGGSVFTEDDTLTKSLVISDATVTIVRSGKVISSGAVVGNVGLAVGTAALLLDRLSVLVAVTALGLTVSLATVSAVAAGGGTVLVSVLTSSDGSAIVVSAITAVARVVSVRLLALDTVAATS